MAERDGKRTMPAWLFFAVLWAGLPPELALERALDAAEPPPALRAAFNATLTSGDATRMIQFDPYAPEGQPRFRLTYSNGSNDELDAVVQGWMEEPDPDSRLFADDLRLSLGDARIAGAAESMAVTFRHRMSVNDGPVDEPFSARMSGKMQLDRATGYVQRIDYRIDSPVTLDDGTEVSEYRQTYNFLYSERWGVSYVVSYDLVARGGRWGLSEERSVRVTLTDVAFGLAGDSKQVLGSAPTPYNPGPTAILR
jgi:hypothetical protein